jgi:hypothetical protein
MPLETRVIVERSHMGYKSMFMVTTVFDCLRLHTRIAKIYTIYKLSFKERKLRKQHRGWIRASNLICTKVLRMLLESNRSSLANWQEACYLKMMKHLLVILIIVIVLAGSGLRGKSDAARGLGGSAGRLGNTSRGSWRSGADRDDERGGAPGRTLALSAGSVRTATSIVDSTQREE